MKKSKTEVETYESIEELNYPQDYKSGASNLIFLGDLGKKEMNDFRI